MAYDDVIPLLGNFGRYQKRIYFLLCLPAICCAFHKMGNAFLHAKADFRCLVLGENATYGLNHTINNQCEIYDNGSAITCNEYIFDRSKYKNTIVMEWDLVCSRAYQRALTDSIFMVGVMLGSIGFGELSDRHGRKPIFFISLVIQVVFGLLAAVAPEFWSYTLARAVVASTTSGVFLVAYVIAMEMVGAKDRLAAGVICQMFFSAGYMLAGLIAYCITDWRWLQFAFTISGVCFFCYWWFIPESARWLITNKRSTEAKVLIQRAAKENKVKITDAQLDELLKADDNKIISKASILDIFKNPNLRKRSLIVFLDWFANCITYYGLSWNTGNLGSNEYLNFIIAGAVEIPAYTFLLFTLNKWGRKTILCSCMLLAGTSLLITMIIPKTQSWLIVTLAMIGKLAITASYGTMYVFSVELFPTVIRNAGLGAASTSARIGAVMAPFINILSEIWNPLPLIIFGVLSLVGGISSLLLPETLNQILPETIEDGEKFGTRHVKSSEEVPLQVKKSEVA